MSNSIPCNREALLQAVQNQLQSVISTRLEEHLVSCAICRQELEKLSGGADWGAEVRKHLSSSELRAYQADSQSAKATATAQGDAAESEMQDEIDPGDRLEFLDPSDDPTKLGRLGSYEIDQVIGRGGMGVVLKAFDAALNRPVAIKVLAAQLATSGSARKRFSREAQAAAAVVHEHVVAIHAVDNSNKLPFIVMPYISGRSLQDRLDATGSLEIKEILRISIQTASGLAAAHAQGLVHRDIKPANILLENSVERVLISDFGLARAVDDASQTQSGFIAGTPQYMAPEQARGEPVDYRADLFSLGSVMYTMCSGHPPFRAETTLAVLRRICEETPRPLREINPEVPDWMQAVITKLHAREPEDRFQSASEVATLLEQYLAHLQQPLVHALPAFHKPAAKAIPLPTRSRRLNWRRVALWSLPASLAAVVTMLFVISFAEQGFERPMSVSATVFPLQDQTRSSGGSSMMSGGGGPPPMGIRQRDPWPAWEQALTSVEQDLKRLEVEMATSTSNVHWVAPDTDSVDDVRQRLENLEQEFKRR